MVEIRAVEYNLRNATEYGEDVRNERHLIVVTGTLLLQLTATTYIPRKYSTLSPDTEVK